MKSLALAIPQPWTSKLAAGEWEGATADKEKIEVAADTHTSPFNLQAAG